MAVPKATMNENHLSQFRKDEVGFSGKGGIVQSEPLTTSTSYSPHQEFRFRSFTSDQRHSLAALNPRESVHCQRPKRC